jgi:hypothetical protein
VEQMMACSTGRSAMLAGFAALVSYSSGSFPQCSCSSHESKSGATSDR